MTLVARRLASIPVRLASDTWLRVVDLVAPTNVAAQDELLRVTGIASSLITREAMKQSPIVVAGEGPRVRLYCVYGAEAIEGVGVNEAALSSSPAESEAWSMSLPCPPDDLSWVQVSLKRHSSRITARDMAETSPSEPEEETPASAASINLESFLRP
jgi:hypothetical protein